MKLDIENTKGLKVKVYDNMGRVISLVRYFDTETCEIEFFVCNREGKILSEIAEDGSFQGKKIRTIWLGAYAEVDGKRVDSRDYCGAV